METNTNRKILIGIVTMFLVAISIVGVTYAYFTAQFTPNMNPESVKITAGNLVAHYEAGTSISVSNVVPGWVSDGLHYYDIDEAATHGGNIYAIKTTYENTQKSEEHLQYLKKMGLAEPLTFSVSNISESTDEDIYYIISLDIIQNGIYDAWTGISDTIASQDPTQGVTKNNLGADRNRLFATLYRGTFDITKSVADNYGDLDEDEQPINKVIGGPYILGDTNAQQIMVKAPETIAVGETNNYFIVFKYANDSGANQLAQMRTLNVKANVIGIQKDNSASVTYNSLIADDVRKITASNMFIRDEGTSATAETLETQNKTAKLEKYKEEHGTKTVWYDEDNQIVIFALANDETSAGFDNDSVTVN